MNMYFISRTLLAGGVGLRKSFIWSHKKPPELVCVVWPYGWDFTPIYPVIPGCGGFSEAPMHTTPPASGFVTVIFLKKIF
jgi:hypothetical protein